MAIQEMDGVVSQENNELLSKDIKRVAPLEKKDIGNSNEYPHLSFYSEIQTTLNVKSGKGIAVLSHELGEGKVRVQCIRIGEGTIEIPADSLVSVYNTEDNFLGFTIDHHISADLSKMPRVAGTVVQEIDPRLVGAKPTPVFSPNPWMAEMRLSSYIPMKSASKSSLARSR